VVGVDSQGVDDLPRPDVAGRALEVLVAPGVHEEGLALDSERSDCRDEVPGLGARHIHLVEDDDPRLRGAPRENRLERVLLLADRDALRVRTRHGTVHGAAVAVDRRTTAALPRAAGALLLEGLIARARNLGANLGLVRARAETREVRLDDLPHEVAAVRVREDLGG